jgi:predicted AAA+ superfamily ATPase
MGKRLVKAPKVYIADAGITAALLGLQSFDAMLGHPAYGTIWEQIVLTNLKGLFPEAQFYFYRTSNGAEIDFVMTINNLSLAIECKAGFSPSLSKGNYNAIEDIAPVHTFVVTPVQNGWMMKPGIDVVSINELEEQIKSKIYRKGSNDDLSARRCGIRGCSVVSFIGVWRRHCG